MFLQKRHLLNFFCKRNAISLGKMIISKFFTLLFYSTRETTKVLCKVQFLKSHFSCNISVAKTFNIKHVPRALAGHLVVFFIEPYQIFGSPSFNIQICLIYIFLYLLYRKRCEAPLRLCVYYMSIHRAKSM